ncbi:MAG TPA: head GIN domain-containing protein [Tepidisphaeraceae bacterium]
MKPQIRNLTAAGTAALLVLVLIGCGGQMWPTVVGSGVSKSETRNTGEFTSVQNDLSANLDITVGPATQVTVEADDNILPLIKTEVRGGTLVITSSSVSIQTKSSLKVTITTPQLTGLVINGSGNANIRGLAGGSFNGTINGSGDITAIGKADTLHGQINGSGNLSLKELTAQSATIAIVGSGNASVAATNSLNASITGSGDISYKPGATLNVQKQIVGSGSIRPM